MRPKIVLASTSKIRMQILSAAGVPFAAVRPDVDEATLKADGQACGLDLEAIAQRLADAKASAIAAPDDTLVIGADQILELDGVGLDKPTSRDDARARLLAMQGRDHTLINAVAVARGGEIVYRRLERPRLFLRPAHAAEIDAYLAAAGDEILSSVAAYQVEALGARLFERIEGDYFSVLGLALFPLLNFLRTEGALAF